MRFLELGNGNYVNLDRVVSVVSPESLPIRRLVQDAKNAERVIDVSCGKKTRSVLITDSEHVILSACETTDLVTKLGDDAHD